MQLQIFAPLVTYPDANADGIAANAVSLAVRFGAKLHAMAINADIPDISNAFSTLLLNTPELISRAETASRHRGEHLLTLFKKHADSAGVECLASTVASPIAALGETAAMRARFFDLCLVGWEAGNEASRMTCEAIIFGSGRPTIILPELAGLGDFGHVAIAWDGSRVAARAVADADLFLKRASRISVITVVDEKPLKDVNSGERLVEMLREHGLHGEVALIAAEDCPIAETLQQTAIERGCSLLIMGGYGHSRMREFVLGGATDGILRNPLMPVLLSH